MLNEKAPEHAPEEPKPLREMPAEEFLKSLPREIAGAKRVETAVHPKGAKHCLVVLRQIHGDPFDKREGAELLKAYEKEPSNEDLRAVQTNVNLIALRLWKQYGRFDVYQEGLLPRQEAALKRFLDNMKRVDATIAQARSERAELEKDPIKNADKLADINERLESAREVRKDISAEIDVTLLGIAPLVKSGKLGARGAEDEKVRNALDAVRKEFALKRDGIKERLDKLKFEDAVKDPELRKFADDERRLLFEVREEGVLRNVVANGDTVGVTVFGGAHAWTGAVEKWNKENPEKQFALVIVTPANYPEKK